jgi:H+/Cl- antiporter ClcA
MKKGVTLKYTCIYIFKWLTISVLIGICVGSASAFFLITLEKATQYRQENLWLVALLPLAGLSAGLLYYYFGKSVEKGNNLLIENIQNPREIIPFRMAVLVYVATMVTHLFGGSAGREGTALQMAGGISDQFSRLFRLDGEERSTLLISAVAAGFGSVFGTPLAGAIFGLEVSSIGKIKYSALFPAVIAALIADFVTLQWQAEHTHYHIGDIIALCPVTFVYSIIAGVVFGLCAMFFSQVLHYLSRLFKQYFAYAPLRPLVGGVIVALAVALFGTTYIGLGIPTIVEAFEQPLPYYGFALKILFTVLTLSAGFKGGEVTPLFFIGATLGNALSYIIPLPIGLLAGMGFVAVFAGATNAPLACIVMGIELFGSQSTSYICIACVSAYIVSGHHSIYAGQIIGTAKISHKQADEGKRIGDI